MTPEELDSLDKPALIQMLLAQAKQIELLTAQVAELETRLNRPPRTPGNSSVPPSKAEAVRVLSAEGEGEAASWRASAAAPQPDLAARVVAPTCQCCSADVSGVAEIVCEEYDRVEIPRIEPDVTQAQLQ